MELSVIESSITNIDSKFQSEKPTVRGKLHMYLPKAGTTFYNLVYVRNYFVLIRKVLRCLTEIPGKLTLQ